MSQRKASLALFLGVPEPLVDLVLTQVQLACEITEGRPLGGDPVVLPVEIDEILFLEVRFPDFVNPGSLSLNLINFFHPMSN